MVDAGHDMEIRSRRGCVGAASVGEREPVADIVLVRRIEKMARVFTVATTDLSCKRNGAEPAGL